MQTTTTTEPVFTVVMVGPSRQVDITWNLLRRVPMKNYLHWVVFRMSTRDCLH